MKEKGKLARRLRLKLVFLYLLISNIFIFAVKAQIPRLWVDPALGTANVGETYTVYVRLDEVTSLYALDIRFAWGSSVLEYVSHNYHIPWWEFPGDGVLNDPVTIARNLVDKNAGTYELVAFSYGTAQPWDGSGVVFDITFQVKQLGECALYFTATTLANQAGGDIEHLTEEGYFEVSGLGDAPVADFTFSPEYPVINRTAILFDGSASYDPDGGGIDSYIWDWGDGTPRETTSSPTTPHTYFRSGTGPTWDFNVKLSVVDVEGSQSKTVIKTVTVRHPAPVARFTTWPPPNVEREVYAVINKNITFDASESFDPDLEAGDPTGGIDMYKWDWGTWKEGEINITFTDSPVYSRNYTYKDPDGFGVSVTVNDTEGRWSSSSLEVTIFIVDSRDTEITGLDVSPTLLPRGLNVTINATITNIGNAPEEFTATAYYNKTSLSAGAQWTKIEDKIVPLLLPAASTVLTFNWDTTDALIDHYYHIMVNTTEVPQEANPANNMRVSEDAILVLQPRPTAIFNYSPSVPISDEDVSFDASQSYDPDGSVVLYKWEFGDGTIKVYTGTNLTSTTTHAFTVPNSYNVTLTVIDNDGYVDSLTQWVEVRTYYPLDISVDVGAIHFNGEIAEFYALVLRSGERINATQINAGLYYSNGTLHQDLTGNLRPVSTGLYRVQYDIPTSAPSGTYTLLVEAKYLRLKGAAIKSFVVSPTLDGWDALLLDIKDEIATIVIPNLGEIKANLTQIKATLSGIEGAFGIINTNVGEIKTSLTLINATLVEIVTDSKGEMLARLEYFLGTQGTITVKLEDIKTRVTAVDNNVATIESSVGTIQAGVGGMQGAVLYVIAAFSAIAAIGAIVALLLLRKQAK